MEFFYYRVPEGCHLYDYLLVEHVFIAYDPSTGETAFFEVNHAREVVPFEEEAMAYVRQRWEDFKEVYPVERGQAIDKKAFDEFGRGL